MTSPRMEFLKRIDIENQELRERNDRRLREAKEVMGRKYLLHPENAMSREKFKEIARVTA